MKKGVILLSFLAITTLQAATSEYYCYLDYHYNGFKEQIKITINDKKSAIVKMLEGNPAQHYYTYVGRGGQGIDVYGSNEGKGMIFVKDNVVAGKNVAGIEITDCK